ncbi:MAG: hypothetical protein WA134_02780 [Rhodoferax sp.]|uniref:hypothetical protein n=1 Tax=Rhodoferax sp. TaxID=50421 RepID=UPI003BB6F177
MKTQSPQSPETVAVLENQNAMEVTSSAIAKLEKAIGKCEEQIKDQQSALPDLAPLLSQREDLLAAIAIGENKNAEIKALDAQLAKLGAQQKDARPALDALKQTIDGLQRRLQESQAELLRLQQEKSVLMRRFLNTRAEALGVEYVAATAVISDLYKRLMALSELLTNHGQTAPLNMHGDGLLVPCFRLDSMVGRAPNLYRPNELFNSINHTRLHWQEWARQEKERLLEIGIDIATR